MGLFKMKSYLLNVLTMLNLNIPNGYWTFKYKCVTRRRHRRVIAIGEEEEENLENEVIVITGANRGMGREMALEFGKRKAIVILGCRNVIRGQETAREISKVTGNPNLEVLPLDLMDLNSVENFAKAIVVKYGRVKVLINNAAVLKSDRTVTKDGNNSVIAVNHLGPFLLTNLLLDSLSNAAPSRVVMMSSTSLLLSQLSLKDFSLEKSGFGAMNILPYSNSKHCNALFAMELSKRAKDLGITTYSLCPGVVDTEILLEYPGLSKHAIQCIKKIAGTSSKKAVAEFVMPFATWRKYAKESGNMYHFATSFDRVNQKVRKEKELSTKLWNISADLVQLDDRLEKLNSKCTGLETIGDRKIIAFHPEPFSTRQTIQ